MSRFTRNVVVAFALALGVTLGLLIGLPIARAADCPDYSPYSAINGQNLTNYPLTPSALQDNPTGFGDSIPNPQLPSEGNELDQLFLANDAGNLYIAVTGNTVRNDALENSVIIFIDTDAGATPTILDTFGMSGANALKNLDPVDLADGVKLDFDPEYAIVVWNVLSVQNALLYDLTNPTDTGVALTVGTDFAVNNNNLLGVNSDASYDPLAQQNNAATATLGFEFKLSLATHLGGLANNASINVQALLVNRDGYISNQSLPPINVTAGNNGGGKDCVGVQDPPRDPPELPDFLIDFSNDTAFPGAQDVSFSLSAAGSAPGGTFNGTDLPNRYTAVGQLRATQNNYTCFGDAAVFQNAPTNGSEVDQIFVRADFSKLYLGVTGNVPLFGGNRDSLLIFMDSGSGNGSQILATNTITNGSGALQYLSDAGGGLKFDDGFAPDVVIMYWREGNAHHAILSSTVTNDFIPLTFSTDNAFHTNANTPGAYCADLSNILGVNNIQGDDPIRQEMLADGSFYNPPLAQPPTSGMQFSIPWTNDLFAVETSGGSVNIKIAAGVVSGSGFMSNQWLPPLNETAGSSDSGSVSYSDSPLPLAIPDAIDIDTPGVAADTRAVSIASVDRVTDVNVSVAITHPDVSQLSVTLSHADSGRSVEIVSAGSQTGANLNVTFDSEGAPAVQPSNSLLTFNDVNPNSNWTLTVRDHVTGQTGTIDSWGLVVTDWEGGDIGCLGNFDSIDNPIDLSVEPFSGNQHLNLNLSVPTAPPGSSSGQGIPAAFGGVANALVTQNNHTCFGDATTSLPGTLPGSEMDQIRVTNSNSRLKVAITGNLEAAPNANAFILMLDTDNTNNSPAALPVLSTPPPVCNGLDGLTLDAGFTPDYALVVQRDNTVGVPIDDYNVFLKKLLAGPASATSYSLGRLTRNLAVAGPLGEAIPNQNGSELDQIFIQNDANYLYIGITGNLEANNNTWVVFLQTTTDGSGNRQLNTNHSGWPQALRELNCDQMDTGFQPDFAIVMNRNGGTYHADLVDLLNQPAGIDVTTLSFTSTIGPNTFIGDNTNSVGVSSTVADDTAPGTVFPTLQQDNAASATRGVQFAIDRSFLDHPISDVFGINPSGPPADGTTLIVNAVLVSATGYWSNQTLPGLGGGQNNLAAPPPGGCPGSNIDLGNATTAPGNQFLSYVLRDDTMGNEYNSPSTFTGAGIPTAMGTALTTQNNWTQFGNATLVNPGNPNCTQVAFNNNNIQGVTVSSALPDGGDPCSGPPDADPACATTGMEFDIDFADIGLADLTNPGGPFPTIRLMAVMTGSSGYFSNQFLPPLGLGNSGNKGDIPANWDGDLTNVTAAPGNQYLSYTLAYDCGTALSDINGDHLTDSSDVAALVGVLLQTNTNPCDLVKGDVNHDTVKDGRDIRTFIPAYLAGN